MSAILLLPSGTASTHKKSARHKTPAVAKQQTPSPERYREIQQALAKKGYLAGEPNGVWDINSMEALKRFQEDQNIQATGKLNSLSLIALGLGPKYETVSSTK